LSDSQLKRAIQSDGKTMKALFDDYAKKAKDIQDKDEADRNSIENRNLPNYVKFAQILSEALAAEKAVTDAKAAEALQKNGMEEASTQSAEAHLKVTTARSTAVSGAGAAADAKAALDELGGKLDLLKPLKTRAEGLNASIAMSGAESELEKAEAELK